MSFYPILLHKINYFLLYFILFVLSFPVLWNSNKKKQKLVIISPKKRCIMTGYKIGETLKELRNHRGMTQKMISNELHISRQTYSYYETGQRLPDLDTACKLADYHNITLDQLVITGLHPTDVDPFASLPKEYRQLLKTYHELPLEKQKHLIKYLEFLSS